MRQWYFEDGKNHDVNSLGQVWSEANEGWVDVGTTGAESEPVWHRYKDRSGSPVGRANGSACASAESKAKELAEKISLCESFSEPARRAVNAQRRIDEASRRLDTKSRSSDMLLKVGFACFVALVPSGMLGVPALPVAIAALGVGSLAVLFASQALESKRNEAARKTIEDAEATLRAIRSMPNAGKTGISFGSQTAEERIAELSRGR